MTKTPSFNRSARRQGGKAVVVFVAALALIAVGGTIVAIVLLSSANTPNGSTPLPATAEQIEARLGLLQQEFQTSLQEDQNLERIQAKAQLFTEEHPDESRGHVLLAQVEMGLLQWDLAYASWVRALVYEPDAFELCKMAGFCAAKREDYTQSKKHYLDAVRASGDRADSEVYAALGRLYLTLGDPDQAEQSFNKALAAPGPGKKVNWRHQGHSGLADVAVVRGDYDTAIKSVDHAIKLAAGDSAADESGYHIQKARIYMDAGKPDDALTMLTYTWQAYPASRWRIESARLRARMYEDKGELTKAVNHIALVCDTHQRDPERKDIELANFFALLAQWQIKAGQNDAARTSIHNLQTVAPKHPAIPTLRQATQ